MIDPDGIFPASSNAYAYNVLSIDGLPVVNDFTDDYQLVTSGWDGGSLPDLVDRRYHQSRWDPAGYTDFLYDLANGQLLSPHLTETVLNWAKTSPQAIATDPYANAIVRDLPGGPWPHKAGYLPAGLGFDRRADGTINDAAIITAPDGREFAIAIAVRNDDDQQSFDFIAKSALHLHDLIGNGHPNEIIQAQVIRLVNQGRTDGIDDIVMAIKMIETGETAYHNRNDSGDGPMHRASIGKWMWVVAVLIDHHAEDCVTFDHNGTFLTPITTSGSSHDPTPFTDLSSFLHVVPVDTF